MILVTERCEPYAYGIQGHKHFVHTTRTLSRVAENLAELLEDYGPDTGFILPKGAMHIIATGVKFAVPDDLRIHIITSDLLSKPEVTQILNRFTNGPHQISVVQVANYLGGRK